MWFKSKIFKWYRKAYPAYFDTYSKIDELIKYLSDIENSKGNIPIDTLEVIAFYLKVDPYILLKERKYKLLPKGVNMKKKDSFFVYINQLELSFQENLVFF